MWKIPASTATAVAIPLTSTGVREGMIVPSPSCPSSFRPQQRTVPSCRSAQLCQPPVETATAAVIPLTVTGVKELRMLPLPSWPKVFCPQQRTVPSRRSAQVCKPPAVTAVAVVIPVTRTGIPETSVVVSGSPSWPASFRPQHSSVPSGKRAQV